MGDLLSKLKRTRKAAPPLDVSWRKTEKDGDMKWNEATEKNLREICLKIVPQEMRNTINILLLGNTGAGKSSYINSMKSALADEIDPRVHVENRDKTVTAVLITIGDMETNFKFIDIPGVMETKDTSYPKFLELVMQGKIKRNIPLTTEYTQSVDMAQGDEMPMAGAASESTDGATRATTGTIDTSKSDCVAAEGDETLIPSMVVLILRANRPAAEEGQLHQRIETLRQSARTNRLNIAVVLTAADETSSEELYPIKQSNAQYIFHSPAVEKSVEAASKFTGVPKNLIFPVTNYTEETEVSRAMNILHLYTLRKILSAAMSGYRCRATSAAANPISNVD